MKFKKVLAIAACASMLVGCGGNATKSTSNGTVKAPKFGFIGPLTGDASQYGTAAHSLPVRIYLLVCESAYTRGVGMPCKGRLVQIEAHHKANSILRNVLCHRNCGNYAYSIKRDRRSNLQKQGSGILY